jgi:elongation factor G
MAEYSTENIRNIALAGHAGSGKTELAEALLAQAGTIVNRGSLDKGGTVCDFDPQEKQLGHSLEAAICHLETDGAHVNLIDTPGYPDFLGRTLAVLPAVETAAVVINAQAGIEGVTHRIMEAAQRRKLCRLIVVNKIDAAELDLPGLLEQIRETFGRECLPINLPAEAGGKVIDCFFEPAGEASDFSSVAQAHAEIVDQVVEVDEDLMALYLEQGQELDPQQLHDPFERALREGHLIPVCFTSARTGAGIPELLDVFTRLMPNPGEGNPPLFLKGEGAEGKPVKLVPDPERHAIAHVFKIQMDPFVGRIGIFRVHQGSLNLNGQYFIGDGRKPFKLAHLFRLQGKDHLPVVRLVPGDIGALAKVDEVHFDAVLHDSHEEDHFHLRSVDFPPPMAGLAIRSARRGDEQKLSDALHKLAAEDPSIRIDNDANVNETVVRGLGDLHLRVLLDRMRDRYHIEVETQTPSVPYRETIGQPAEGHHRHKKQTGGAGQFGEVFLRIEPLERGGGFEFVNGVVGGAIPGQFIPAVEKGVRQAIAAGALAGFSIEDLRVTVYDGKYHSVDSKEVAFVAAGKKALLDAVAKASPIVLEPIVNIQISARSEHTGDIGGDLLTRRGHITGTRTLAGDRVSILGQAPLGELQTYTSRLKSLTGGEGTYTLEFSHYEAVPAGLQQALVNDYKPVVED